MDEKTISDLVGTLGFPIVVAGVLSWILYKTSIDYTVTIDKMRETVEKNTQLIQQLLDQLTKGDK